MMKILVLCLTLSFCLPINIIFGQQSGNNAPLVLEKLYGRLVNNYNDQVRMQINDSILEIITDYVKSDTIFTHRFTNLKYLGQITSPDSSLKIVTWNLVLRDEPSQYFCFFIRKPDGGSDNIIYSLNTVYHKDDVRTDTLYSERNWYGALYYDLRPYEIDSNKYWVVLAIDYGNDFISRKIIDVISFTDDDTIVFGHKWFHSEEETKFREVFQYASNGMMSLRFTSNKSIVFDHLVPFLPSQINDRQYYGPDYSYDAYNFENGAWKLTINVDARNIE